MGNDGTNTCELYFTVETAHTSVVQILQEVVVLEVKILGYGRHG